jgi:hypothetical protein
MNHRWCIVSDGDSFLNIFIWINTVPPTKSSEKYGVILLSHTKMKTCIIDTVMKIKDCEGGLFIFWWWEWEAMAMVAMVPAVVSITAVLLWLRRFTGNGLHHKTLNVSLHDGDVSGGDSDNPIQWVWYNKINPDVSLIFVAVVQTLWKKLPFNY